MLKLSKKFHEDYKEKYMSKIYTEINNTEEIEKYKAKRNQGWRR